MCKWTIDEDNQKIENDELEKMNIFTLPKKRLTHYTSREVFWKIIEDETLLARHVKFSNDIEENEIGIKKIKDAMAKNKKSITKINTLPFMVCFCGEKDLLSQWRGYAKEGIAIVFDFSKGLYGSSEGFSPYHCFTIMNNDTYQEEGKGYLSNIFVLHNGNKKEEKYYMGAILAPYQVFYTNGSEYADDIILDKVKQLCQDPNEETIQQRIKRLTPYIKNDKFNEEDEYRLIFDLNTLLQETQYEMLKQKYISLEVDGVKKPNIKVKFGNQEDAFKIATNIYYSNNELTNRLKQLKTDVEKKGIQIQLIKNQRKYPIEKDEILISHSKFQEEVCALVRQYMRHQPVIDNIKIWCDGHLPIRQIIVGPSKDAGYMANSIREYIKTKYWMKDVEVNLSEIPLRT